MFERYTEKAIKVIILAQEEAHRLGHNFVGTEQILLGLIGEGTGVAAKVLKSMGINLKTARIEVEKIIGRGSGFVAAEIPFTPRAKLVLELSVEEAQQLGHNYIGTEHLLLGLIREGEGLGARVLENLDIDLGKVRTQVLRMLSLELPIRDTVRHSSKLLFEGFWSILAEMEKQGKINSDLLNSGKIKSVIEFLGSRKTNDFQQVNEYKMPPNLHWRALRGQVIDNKYFLTELLGYGAYGGVYLADEVFQKRDKAVEQVAIKLMIDDQTDSQLKELILSRKLQHPNVMACFERGECNLMEIDHLYLVMELADYSLETKLAEGDLSKVEKISLIKDITQALVYLHSQSFSLPDKKEPVKFVHLDLKPANVMKIGNLWKLTDFGLIRSISSQTALTNNPSGTALYAPPESYSGEISTAWDIWSLGIIIVKVLTRKYPFFAENLQQLQKKICDEEPDLSGLPKQFEKLVQGCLDKNRKNRWTAQQVLDEILSIQTSCYLLLYDLGLQFEGIYTIQTDNRHKILVFYEKEDANNFLKTLKEENNSYIYSIEVFDPEAIDNFCNILGIECEWITKNIKVILPEKRIYEKNESKETDQIYVLLYNAGKNNEGIHTIKNNDRNKVLMFKAKDDAIRFANLLEAENFPLPTIQDFAKSEIIKFCQSADYDYELIPEGQLAIPPHSNVEEYDIENLHFYNEPKSNSIWDNLKKVGESILGLWDHPEDSSASIFTIEEVHHNVKKPLRINAEIIQMTIPVTITEDDDSDLKDS